MMTISSDRGCEESDVHVSTCSMHDHELENNQGVHVCTGTSSTNECVDKTPLLELFCGMHVGVNLREAHVTAIQSDRTVGSDRIVYSMC